MRLGILDRIDTAQLLDVQLSPDRMRLKLRLRDAAGQSVSLMLPSGCLNAILSVLPRDVEARQMHHFEEQAMTVAEKSEDLILTLRARDGDLISFQTNPLQVRGRATITSYERHGRIPAGIIH